MTIFAGLAAFILLPGAFAQAQTRSGRLVPTRAIIAIVQSNGLDPVARPMREGPTYVVRAVNRRGFLVRVVLDARSGEIRAVNRIVSGPGSPDLGRPRTGSPRPSAPGFGSPGPGAPGPIAMRPRPYGPPPEFDRPSTLPHEADDMPPVRSVRPPPYGPPPEFDQPSTVPDEVDSAPRVGSVRPPTVHAPARPTLFAKPPLPRPRPANVAVQTPPETGKPVAIKPAIAAKPSAAKPAAAKPAAAKPPVEAKTTTDPKAADQAKPQSKPQSKSPSPTFSPRAAEKSPPAQVAPINE